MSSIIKQCNNILYQLKQIKILLKRIYLNIITCAYIILKHDHCNAALLTDMPKVQENDLTKL